MSSRGKLFVFEGTDGVGKTTIAKAVVDILCDGKQQYEYLSFPGTEPGTIGELVYRIHHDIGSLNLSSISPTSLQVMHVAAHVDTIERRIIPLLHSGVNVVLDRYWWSTLAYGASTDSNMRSLQNAINAEIVVWDEITPDVLFFVKRESFRNISDGISERVLPHYKKLLKSHSPKVRTITIDNICLADSISIAVQVIRDAEKANPNAIPVQASLLRPPSLPANAQSKYRPSSLAKLLKPTVVYDTYWLFAAKRQEIFYSRLRGDKKPWTDDHILQEHKFTNAYRASDRVSQYLIRNVIYSGPQNAEDIFFRIMLFKLFNKVETWELLEQAFGEISIRTFDILRYDKILTAAIESNVRIYSAAYIMPTGGRGTIYSRKHRMHLALIDQMIRDGLPSKIESSHSMGNVFELLLSYPGIGNFLAYQFATDINYSELTNFSETQFVVPGPGALDGIKKCFEETGGLTGAEIIKVVMEHQEAEIERLGISFKSLWGRPLQLIDCQNLFCETDKYSRVKHPEFRGDTGRSRIKQKFTPSPRPISYWYPPKWGLNDSIRNGILP
jgi:thymidylate kinase